MDLELTGRVAVVTGASKGIGLAVTRALVDEGAQVVAGARSTEALENLPGVTPVATDLTQPQAPAELVQRALDDHGRIDVLVNNVGALKTRLDGFLGTSDDDFQWAMLMNFFIAMRATRAVITAMVERGSGVIVNVASVNAFYEPDAGVLDYGAAKAALVDLTNRSPRSSARAGSASTTSHPGRSKPTCGWATAGWPTRWRKRAESTANGPSDDRRGYRRHPHGPVHDAGRGATLVVLLASDRAGNVTGSNFVIDGGLIKTT